MSEAARTDTAGLPVDSSRDVEAQLASLRAAGAGDFDPARLHYMEVLATRASAHEGSVRQLLNTRLMHTLTAFQERFELARSDAKEAVVRAVQQHPQAEHELQQLLAGGKFSELRKQLATLKFGAHCATLRALVQRLDQQAAGEMGKLSKEDISPRAELKAIRDFRTTWSKLSVDKQVAQALEQAPKNAGPINSHMLILRSLELMRDISPDYLNRFMTYADTLLSLDQREKEKPAAPKKRTPAKAAKK